VIQQYFQCGRLIPVTFSRLRAITQVAFLTLDRFSNLVIPEAFLVPSSPAIHLDQVNGRGRRPQLGLHLSCLETNPALLSRPFLRLRFPRLSFEDGTAREIKKYRYLYRQANFPGAGVHTCTAKAIRRHLSATRVMHLTKAEIGCIAG
jgi:hypothetical protein